MAGVNLCLFSKLSAHSPWIRNEDIDWSKIIKGHKPEFFKKDDIIYLQNDVTNNMYLVDSGRVCLYLLSNSGEEKSFFIAEAGCIFGELSIIDEYPNICNAVAVTNSYVYTIPKDVIYNEFYTNPEFSIGFVKLLVKKTRIMAAQIKELSFNDAKYRVYSAMVHLFNKHGSKSSDYYNLTIRFTHQEMANLTGLSRVSVSNIFSDLTKQGIIQKEDGYLVAKDLGPFLNYIISQDDY